MPSANKTTYYELNQWQSNEYPKRQDYVDDNAIIDAALHGLETGKLATGGDASEVTTAFTQAATRTNLTTGEKMKISLGKITKWFADLKDVAFSGNAADLTTDSTHQLTTDGEKSTWNSKAAGTHTHTSSAITDFLASVVGSVLTGLSTASNAVITATDTVLTAFGKLQAQISLTASALTTHAGNTNNPHAVTLAQVGGAKNFVNFASGSDLLADIKAQTTSTMFFAWSNAVNNPDASWGTGIITCQGSTGDNNGVIFISQTGRIYTGKFVSGTFSGWHSVYDSVNKPTAADLGFVTKGVLTTAAEVNVINRASGVYSVRGVDAFSNGVSYYTLIHNVDQGDSNYAFQMLISCQVGQPTVVYMRSCVSANTWGNWCYNYTTITKPTPADIGAAAQTLVDKFVATNGKAISIDNLNTMLGSGLYCFAPNSTGAPFTDWGFVLCAGYPGDNNWATQFVMPMTGGNLYYRRLASGAWQPWDKIYNAGQKPTPTDIGAATIVSGTYTGNGNVGSGAPNTLNFAAQPKFVLIMDSASGHIVPFLYGQTAARFASGGKITCSWPTTTSLSWYAIAGTDTFDTSSSNPAASAGVQCNANGVTYRYIYVY